MEKEKKYVRVNADLYHQIRIVAAMQKRSILDEVNAALAEHVKRISPKLNCAKALGSGERANG